MKTEADTATAPKKSATIMANQLYVYYLNPKAIQESETDWLHLQETDRELFELGVIHHEKTRRFHPKEFQTRFNMAMISTDGLIVIK